MRSKEGCPVVPAGIEATVGVGDRVTGLTAWKLFARYENIATKMGRQPTFV